MDLVVVVISLVVLVVLHNPGQGNAGGAGTSGGGPAYGSGGGGGAGGAGQDGTAPQGGHGGLGIQLPSTFRDPTSSVGFPGPGPAKYFVAGGGGGVSDAAEPTTGQGGGADLMLEQDLVHIILIQELQDFLLNQIVDLEEVVVDHQQLQVVQVVPVLS